MARVAGEMVELSKRGLREVPKAEEYKTRVFAIELAIDKKVYRRQCYRIKSGDLELTVWGNQIKSTKEHH